MFPGDSTYGAYGTGVIIEELKESKKWKVVFPSAKAFSPGQWCSLCGERSDCRVKGSVHVWLSEAEVVKGMQAFDLTDEKMDDA